MTDTIIRERRALLIVPVENNKYMKARVIGSLIYRDYESGKHEVLLSNKKTLDK